MDYIIDTDVVSMVGKIRRVTLLKRIFPNSKIYVTQETIRELERARKIGVDFMDDVINNINVIELDEKIVEKGKEIAESNKKLHMTEICSILLCKKKGMVLITNDKVAKKFCIKNDVIWMDIVELLRFGFLKGRIKEHEGWEIIREIEEKDKTRIKNAERIFEKEG